MPMSLFKKCLKESIYYFIVYYLFVYICFHFYFLFLLLAFIFTGLYCAHIYISNINLFKGKFSSVQELYKAWKLYSWLASRKPGLLCFFPQLRPWSHWSPCYFFNMQASKVFLCFLYSRTRFPTYLLGWRPHIFRVLTQATFKETSTDHLTYQSDLPPNLTPSPQAGCPPTPSPPFHGLCWWSFRFPSNTLCNFFIFNCQDP